MRLWQRALGGLTAIVAAAVIAPAAIASTTPTLALDQSAGNTAGSTTNLGLNLSFSNTGTDSPQGLTLNLPPGLLANAAVNGGRCLTTAASTTPVAACQIGSGTVTAQPDVPIVPIGLPLPVPVSVSFYLVAPPSPGDLAGLEVYSPLLGEQLGSTGDILIRPSGDPGGVGATIKLTLPDTLDLTLPIVGKVPAAQVSITSIASTFTGLRYPATCPGTPANLRAAVTSYSDPTVHSLSAPLPVTGCSSLAYAPKFSVSATRDSGDKEVSLSTTITQGASEAPNRDVALTFPTTTFGVNLNALRNLCTGSVSGCPTVGSVTASSPLYPTPLTGKAYLTGNSSGLALTLQFPSPFPLTLSGAIDQLKNSATFTGLPDIPLTNLQVALNGGPTGLFLTSCQYPSGTATAGLTDQNGDRSRSVPANFTVSGCPGASGTGTGGGRGTGGGAGTGGGGTGTGGSSGGTTLSPTSTAKIVSKSVSGLAKGKPTLTFKVAVGRKAAKLDRLTVGLPSGLSFTRHKVGKRFKVIGVRLKGATIKSLALSHKHLVITFKKASRTITVTMGSRSLKESKGLRAQAQKHKLKRLKLTVSARNTKHKTKKLTATVTKLHL